MESYFARGRPGGPLITNDEAVYDIPPLADRVNRLQVESTRNFLRVRWHGATLRCQRSSGGIVTHYPLHVRTSVKVQRGRSSADSAGIVQGERVVFQTTKEGSIPAIRSMPADADAYRCEV